MNSLDDNRHLGNGRYRAVTLDMGFTLVDLHSGYPHFLVKFLNANGRVTTLAEVKATMRSFWEEWIPGDAQRTWEPTPEADRAMSLEMDRQMLARLGITDLDLVVQANRRANELFHDVNSYTIFPEVVDALSALRRAVPRLGIVSNWGWALPDLCEQLRLAGYFDFIISSARVGSTKPHPRIFREALACAGTTPEQTLHVGDSVFADVLGAQALGITGVLLDRSGGASPDGYPMIRNLVELLELI